VNPKQAPSSPPSPIPSTPPASSKRFRIQRLEDRIAPKKGGKDTNNCPAGTSGY
jgi:hypothetical protein